ncbi:MAG: hypothetical protein II982_00485 [Clostridia bacterium]|nr:hypothetical protein [Clostridia bacterium]
MNTIGRVYTVSFFGHRNIENVLDILQKLEKLIKRIITEQNFVEFLVGRNGEFDKIVASSIISIKKSYRNDNSVLVLVLPYVTAEYKNNTESFEKYFDEIEICNESEKVHFKSAIKIRNRHMIDRSDLIICYVNKKCGGAYQAVRYAMDNGKDIINIAEILE